MPKINITVPHRLPEAEARRRIEAMIADLKTKFGDQVSDVREVWTGNQGVFSFKAMGFSVSGQGTIASDQVNLQMDLPFAAFAFKSRIEEEITRETTRILA